MNKKIKIISFLLVLGFILNGLLFAEAPSTNLTDSDVKNFCKNFEKIESEMDAIGLSLESEESPTKAQLLKFNTILNKNGIKGSNATDKFFMISFCYSCAVTEKQMEKNPEAAVYLKMLGLDPLTVYEISINKKDYAVVLKNYNLLEEVLGDFDFGLDFEDDSDEEDDDESEEDFYNSYYKSSWETNVADSKELNEIFAAIENCKKDLGRVYKVSDSKNSSKYKKINIIYSAGNYEDNELFEKVQIYQNGALYLNAEIDSSDRTLIFIANVYNQDFESYKRNGARYTKKVKEFHITGLEGYEREDPNGYRNLEYVIKTKEGAVFSFFAGFNPKQDVGITQMILPGVKNPVDIYLEYAPYY